MSYFGLVTLETVAERSKARVCSGSVSGIAGSNPGIAGLTTQNTVERNCITSHAQNTTAF